MLKVYLGDYYIFWEKKISYPSAYFDARYEEEWLSSEWGRRIIREIDKSEYIDGDYIKSPVFKGISPRDLSTGCKALLILLNVPGAIVSGDRMGDNCYPVLFEMAKEMDLTITITRVLWRLKDHVPFNMVVADTGEIINTPVEMLKARQAAIKDERAPEWYDESVFETGGVEYTGP